jgi:hypothetical protein
MQALRIKGKISSSTRNLYDWISIFLLIGCISTHIADMIRHTTYLAQTHIRLMAVTVIVVSIRLLKTSQIIVPRFGALVQMLYFSSADMIAWFVLYCAISLAFST